MISSRLIIPAVMIRAVPYVVVLTLGVSAYNIFTDSSSGPVSIGGGNSTLTYDSQQISPANLLATLPQETGNPEDISGPKNDSGSAPDSLAGYDSISVRGVVAGFSSRLAAVSPTLNDPSLRIPGFGSSDAITEKLAANNFGQGTGVHDLASAFSSAEGGTGGFGASGLGFSAVTHSQNADAELGDLGEVIADKMQPDHSEFISTRSDFDYFGASSSLVGGAENLDALVSPIDFADSAKIPDGIGTSNLDSVTTAPLASQVPESAATLGLVTFALMALALFRRR